MFAGWGTLSFVSRQESASIFHNGLLVQNRIIVSLQFLVLPFHVKFSSLIDSLKSVRLL